MDDKINPRSRLLGKKCPFFVGSSNSPPREQLPDPDIAWEACIGFVPTSLDEAKVALRNRNLWDENTDSKYQCNSTNEWVNNRADEEKKAAPECPCVADFGEECPLADK